MTQEITAAVRPVPWDGSFIPLPAHLCQHSQPPDAETVTSFLCERCRAFAKWHKENRNPTREKFYNLVPWRFKEWILRFEKEKSFRLYQNWNHFYESYEKGCHLCSIIFGCLGKHINPMFLESWSSNANAVRLRFSQNTVEPEVRTSRSILGDFFPCDTLENEREIGPMSVATCSEPVLRLAATWIANCVNQHPKCSKQFDPQFHPTRLIAIVEQSGSRVARLEETNSGKVSLPYVALSYCWGRESTVKLLTKNYQQLSSHGIPIDQLPNTMQHAIDLALHLGMQWIWIDALCILQDDDEDWKQEAARMADVYANSVLTIAAWSASSSDQGLFTIRDPLSVAPCKLYHSPEKNNSIFVVPWREAVPHDLPPPPTSPLYQRGWVVQERLFAPRTLNVGSFISWECKMGTCSEFQPDLTSLNFPVKNMFDNFVQEERMSQSEQILEVWNEEIVPFFTHTRLTRKSDRLVAISGAIQRLSDERDWRNIHGLWEPFLVQQLEWVSNAPKNGSSWSSERSGAAPTWSWASIDGPVKYNTRRYVKEFSSKVLLAQKIPTISQANDEVVSEHAALSFKGHLFQLKIGKPAETYEKYLADRGQFPVAIRNQELLDWQLFKDLSQAVIRTPCWFLLLSVFTSSFQLRCASGLALIEGADTPGKYERIGYVWGKLKHLSRKLRRQFDEPPTQEITII